MVCFIKTQIIISERDCFLLYVRYYVLLRNKGNMMSNANIISKYHSSFIINNLDEMYIYCFQIGSQFAPPISVYTVCNLEANVASCSKSIPQDCQWFS